jgi:hypothetical protein
VKIVSILAIGALIGSTAIVNAQSSGAAAGAATGAVGGAVVGGPVGAVVGGVGGAIVGGILDDADRPRVREYVVQQKRPSVQYDREIAVGGELPSTIQTYEVPETVVTTTKQRTGWHYAVVNNRTVMVDNRTRRIIQIVE